jgi:hypothetical protein
VISCVIQNRKEKNQPLIIIIACIVIDNLFGYLYRRMPVFKDWWKKKIITIFIDENVRLFIQDILVMHAHAHVSKFDLLRWDRGNILDTMCTFVIHLLINGRKSDWYLGIFQIKLFYMYWKTVFIFSLSYQKSNVYINIY